MKTRLILVWAALMVFGWVFLFQGTQTAQSSPLLRITLTPPPTRQVTPTTPATLPPPATVTSQPLIPVTGSANPGGSVDFLIVGGLVLLVMGVVGLAWPARRTAR